MSIFSNIFLNFASYKYTKRSELDYTLLYSNYGTFTKNNRSYGARSALFPLHPAALSLAEVQITTRGNPSPQAPHNAASTLVPP